MDIEFADALFYGLIGFFFVFLFRMPAIVAVARKRFSARAIVIACILIALSFLVALLMAWKAS